MKALVSFKLQSELPTNMRRTHQTVLVNIWAISCVQAVKQDLLVVYLV